MAWVTERRDVLSRFVEAPTGSAFALAYVLLGPTPVFLVAAILLAP